MFLGTGKTFLPFKNGNYRNSLTLVIFQEFKTFKRRKIQSTAKMHFNYFSCRTVCFFQAKVSLNQNQWQEIIFIYAIRKENKKILHTSEYKLLMLNVYGEIKT